MIMSIHTDLRASDGERWMVPCDSQEQRSAGGMDFEDWVQPYLASGKVGTETARLLEEAWRASRQRHTASLTRIGWLDQKGRIWKQIPPQKDFQGGSLMPLLVDCRD